MSQRFDVIILGLGGMGSAAASHLAARGQRVLGLDQFKPPHDQGSSHGRSRVIRQAHYEDPAYVPLLLRSYELWRQLERDSGKTLLIDRHPAHRPVLIVSPCSGHGFKFCPVVGEIAADLIEHGKTQYNIGPFQLSRFNPN